MCLVCSLLAIKHMLQARRSSVCALRIPARLSLFDSYKEVCIKWLCRDFVCKWCFQEVSWINESKTLIQENGGSNNLTVEGSGHSIRAYPLVSWQGNLTMWILLQKIENLYSDLCFQINYLSLKLFPKDFVTYLGSSQRSLNLYWHIYTSMVILSSTLIDATTGWLIWPVCECCARYGLFVWMVWDLQSLLFESSHSIELLGFLFLLWNRLEKWKMHAPEIWVVTGFLFGS